MSHKIAYVQPIFAPDEMRFQRNMDSLHSMAEYLRTYPTDDVTVMFGGWAADEYWDQIESYIKENFKNLKVLKRFEKNFGKAFIVNNLAKSLTDEAFILNADSDIIFDVSEPNLFRRLLECAAVSVKARNMPFGMVALNQKGQCCHLPVAEAVKYQYTNSFNQVEVVGFPRGNGGIAGGCIFVNAEVWKHLGGYREMGVYAGDDAYLLIDIYNINHSIQMFKSLAIIHPQENDEIYAKWKFKVCQRDSAGGQGALSDEKIDEAEGFWTEKSKGA